MDLNWSPGWHILSNLGPVGSEQFVPDQDHEIFRVREIAFAKLSPQRVHVTLVALIFGAVVHVVRDLEEK